MTRRNRSFQIFIVVFHIGVVLTLFASSAINPMVMPRTETITTTVDSYDALSTMGVSEGIELDKDYTIHGFVGKDGATDNVPVPTLALLSPFVLLLWVKRCRGLIKKRLLLFAFPVF